MMVTDDRGSPPPGEPERFTPAREAALVGMTLCAAFAVRFIPALWPSFWWDEVFTVAMSNRPLSDIVRLTSQDVHPPLYYFVVHLLMAIGDRLGGLLTSLTWLRMASIVPGLLTCWIAWWAARRCWGPRSASLVLILFAFSPALAFYSVELRNYSMSHAALLGSTIFLLSVTSGAGSRPWAAVCGYVLCMSIALYSTNLALLYLFGHGVIFLIEILWLSTDRKRLFIHGATALAASLALYSFWIPTVISQNAHLNTMKLGWLPAAELKTVFSTFFFYLPYGPIGPFDTAWVWDGWPRLLMLATMVGFATLGIALLLQRKAAAQPRSSGDRLFLYAGLMTVVPLGLAFMASVSGSARIFLPLRYNLLAVPFWNLFFIRCLLLLKPGSVRRSALIVTLSASAGFTLFLQAHRVRDRDDFRCLETEVFGAEQISDDDRFYWLAPELLPWLNHIGKFQVGSYETALNSPGDQTGSVWFLSHQVTQGGWGRTRLPSRLLFQNILATSTLATQFDCSRCFSWAGVWRIPLENLSLIDEEIQFFKAQLETRRTSIPGGQVILPDSEWLRRGQGWGEIELTPERTLFAWTIGDHQVLNWEGPINAGLYEFTAVFWRTHPFPSADLSIQYLLPGDSEWKSMETPLGSVVLEGPVRITQPYQGLHLEFKIPSWVPSERIEDSEDPRSLGFQFLSIELAPIENSELP